MAKNPGAETRLATLIMVLIHVLCTIGFFSCEYGTFDSAIYDAYIGVALMMLVGFGYLMTFLKLYGLGAVGFTFILTILSVEINVLLAAYLQPDGAGTTTPTVDNGVLMDGNFAAATILISYGCLIGKASPMQLVLLTVFESFAFQINRNMICVKEFAVEDAGGTILIHMFGAYFGLAVARVLGKPIDPKDAEGTSTTSDVLSLVGTTFLWLYWPSFNGGGYTGGAFSDPNFDGTDAGRAITNTIIALLASCCTTFITSGLICGRLNPVDIQNATLAGGVAVGAVARMDIGIGWASVIGGTGGIISTLGYNFIQPLLLSKIGLHDSCGVNNLHGMPAIFGAVVSMIMVEARRDSGLANDSGDAGMKQLYAFLVSLGFCLVAGVVTGLILKVAKSVQEKFASKDEEPHFLDDKYWDIAYGGQ